jgi:hypothetical protein
MAPVFPKGISWETCIALSGSAVLLVSVILLVDHPPLNQRNDFSVTYIGSRMVWLGTGAAVYDLAEQEKLKKSLLPDAEPLIVAGHVSALFAYLYSIAAGKKERLAGLIFGVALLKFNSRFHLR